MERLKALLRQTEFHLLLFVLCMVLFGWPVVTFSDMRRLEVMFVYLFVVWALVIVVLFLVSRSLESADDSDKSPNGEP
jgi:hypothetical protein